LQRTLRVLRGLRIFFEDSWTNRGPANQVRATPPQPLALPLLGGHILRDGFSQLHPDFHFHAQPEPVEDRHQAIDSETPEIRVADTREVGCRNAGAPMSRAHAQAFPIERLDDFGGKDRLDMSNHQGTSLLCRGVVGGEICPNAWVLAYWNAIGANNGMGSATLPYSVLVRPDGTIAYVQSGREVPSPLEQQVRDAITEK